MRRNTSLAADDPLARIDFNAWYRREFLRSSFGRRSAADWDRRASHRHRFDSRSDYNRAFLGCMDLTDVGTALDIGCGVGNLALPLARRLRRVYALDFSPEMLRHLRRRARQAGLRNLRTFQLSWSDRWKGVPRADVAICSRAMGVTNLRAALAKMTRHARRRCYATLHVGGSFLSADVLRLLDRPMRPRPDYIFAVNLLYQMGYHAQVDFIRSDGGRSYASEEEFLDGIAWRIGPLRAAECERLARFYRGLPRDPDGRRRHHHTFTWALLAWETA